MVYINTDFPLWASRLVDLLVIVVTNTLVSPPLIILFTMAVSNPTKVLQAKHKEINLYLGELALSKARLLKHQDKVILAPDSHNKE